MPLSYKVAMQHHNSKATSDKSLETINFADDVQSEACTDQLRLTKKNIVASC